jgi:hypothetical protein
MRQRANTTATAFESLVSSVQNSVVASDVRRTPATAPSGSLASRNAGPSPRGLQAATMSDCSKRNLRLCVVWSPVNRPRKPPSNVAVPHPVAGEQ